MQISKILLNQTTGRVEFYNLSDNLVLDITPDKAVSAANNNIQIGEDQTNAFGYLSGKILTSNTSAPPVAFVGTTAQFLEHLGANFFTASADGGGGGGGVPPNQSNANDTTIVRLPLINDALDSIDARATNINQALGNLNSPQVTTDPNDITATVLSTNRGILELTQKLIRANIWEQLTSADDHTVKIEYVEPSEFDDEFRRSAIKRETHTAKVDGRTVIGVIEYEYSNNFASGDYRPIKKTKNIIQR